MQQMALASGIQVCLAMCSSRLYLRMLIYMRPLTRVETTLS